MSKPRSTPALRTLSLAATSALLVGGSIAPAYASAVEATPTDTASQSVEGTAAAESSAAPTSTPTASVTPEMAEAIERDLDMSVEEYLEESKASEQATELRAELEQQDIKASASVKDGKPVLKVAAKDEQKAKSVAQASASPVDITVVDELTSTGRQGVTELYRSMLGSLDADQFLRITSIMDTGDGIKIRAKNLNQKMVAKASAAAASGKLSLEQFVAQVNKTSAQKVGIRQSSGPAELHSGNDIFGGMGYAKEGPRAFPIEGLDVCSLGFPLFDANGDSAYLTAGHCASDGAATIIGLADQPAPGIEPTLGQELGDFGRSQFGGPDNSGIPLEDVLDMSEEEREKFLAEQEPGTDYAIIENLNPVLNISPEVTQWTDGMAPEEKTARVTGLSKAAVGASACSVGRTTGWGCSKILGEGVAFMLSDRGTLRAVYGYEAANPNLSVSDSGDSGGAVMVGTKAVGTNTGGEFGADGKPGTADDTAIYASVDDMFANGYLDGYELQLYLNAPAASVQTGASLKPGSTIDVQVPDAPEGTKLALMINGEESIVELDADGSYSTKVPSTEGKVTYSMHAVNGFSTSGDTDLVITVDANATPSPTPTATPTSTSTPTESSSPTVTPSESATSTSTQSASPTATPTESANATESATASGSATASASPSSTASESASESTSATTVPDDHEPSASTQPKNPANPLADTGSNSMLLASAAGLAALTGILLLVLRRRSGRHS